MPRVQKLNRQVGLAPLPGVRRQAAETAASEGAGLHEARARTAEQLGQLGAIGAKALTQEAGAWMQRERQRADDVATTEYDNKLAEWEAKRLYDPEAGALRVKGKDAMPLPEAVRDEFNQYADDLEIKLGTPEQRARALKIRSNRGQNLDLTLRRHVYGEMQAYEQGELKASVDNATQAAIANAMDPRRVGVELARAEQAITTHAPNLGLGPEQIAEQIGNVRTAVHVGVIDQMLANDNPQAAQIYFEEVKDQIQGDKLAAIEKALEEGGLRKRAQETSDKLIAENDSLGLQREAAKKIDDPKLRDAVMERLEHEAAVRDRADRELDEAQLTQAYNLVEMKGDIRDVPPSLLSRLSGPSRSGLMAYARAKAAGTPIQTDWNAFYKLIDQAGTDPEGFTKASLIKYRGSLDEPEFKQLASIQLSMRQQATEASAAAAAKARALIDGYLSSKEVIDNVAGQYKLDTNAKADTTEGRAVRQLRSLVDADVQQFTVDNKRKPTNEEMTLMVHRIMGAKIKDPDWKLLGVFHQTGSVVDLKDRLGIEATSVPSAERARIEASLRAGGLAPTDELILTVYLQYLIRAGGGGQ